MKIFNLEVSMRPLTSRFDKDERRRRHLFNKDGSPRVHVRRNGSRYIYPEALAASPKFLRAIGQSVPQMEEEGRTGSK